MLPSLTVGLLTLTKAMSDQANPRNPRAGRPCHMKLKSSSKASVAIMILLSLLVAGYFSLRPLQRLPDRTPNGTLAATADHGRRIERCPRILGSRERGLLRDQRKERKAN